MEENKITTVEKVKDPRRVEQGKKLATISREAKERKVRERAEAAKADTTMDVLPYLVIVAIVGASIYGGYYYNNNIKKEEPSKEEPIKKPTPKLEQL